MILDGPDGAVCVVAEQAAAPEWTCNACDHLTRPSALLNDLNRACAVPGQPSPELVALIERVIGTLRPEA